MQSITKPNLLPLLSHTVPVVSDTLADRGGFTAMLLVSHCAYLPTPLLLIATKSLHLVRLRCQAGECVYRRDCAASQIAR